MTFLFYKFRIITDQYNNYSIGLDSLVTGGSIMMDPDYDEPTDWAEFPLYLGSPPPSPCHGFGPQDTIPGRLVITTEVVQGEEVFKSIVRQQREGRTRGSTIEVGDMN